MPHDLSDPAALRALLAHAVPAVLALGALLAPLPALRVEAVWRAACATVRLALVAAVGSAVAAVAEPGGGGAAASARPVVLVLVALVGWVLARYSRTYLEGEPGQHRFVRWLLGALAGASLVVATDDLLVLALAWIATSLALQNLLVFYRDRPNAQMAAHKKFLASRLADVCVLTAVALLYSTFGTRSVGELAELAAASHALAPAAQVAVTLVAVAVLLKSAQLPVHGWLIQVMEAPTPVSALLHAGVINLGGFVLIRLGELVSATPAAQVLLVVVGGLTAVIAGLVTTTRISVKVALAWSTCAQMGFMAMQCGLGLYEMALLHLVAHSLYKAHAFLAAGGTVQRSVVGAMSPQAPTRSTTSRVLVALASLAAVFVATHLAGVPVLERPALAAMSVVVALAVTPFLGGAADGAGRLARWSGPAIAFAVVVLYFALHHVLEAWLGTAPSRVPTPTDTALAAFVAGAFVLLFAVQTYVASRGSERPARLLYAWVYGGLFLDERFTRLTLRVWPVRISSEGSSIPNLRHDTTR
ncbi:MAG: NADH-quinone oxidoreductase subunit L [Planctomycetota bacterium]